MSLVSHSYHTALLLCLAVEKGKILLLVVKISDGGLNRVLPLMLPPFCMPIKTSDQQLTFCIAPFSWCLPYPTTTPRSLLFSLSLSPSVLSISPSVVPVRPVGTGICWEGCVGGVRVKEGNSTGKVIAGAPPQRHHLPLQSLHADVHAPLLLFHPPSLPIPRNAP